MGIYDSRKSAWQRHKEGKPQDHAGKGVIGEVVGDDKVVKQPLVEEEPKVEEEEDSKPAPRKKTSKKSSETE